MFIFSTCGHLVSCAAMSILFLSEMISLVPDTASIRTFYVSSLKTLFAFHFLNSKSTPKFNAFCWWHKILCLFMERVVSLEDNEHWFHAVLPLETCLFKYKCCVVTIINYKYNVLLARLINGLWHSRMSLSPCGQPLAWLRLLCLHAANAHHLSDHVIHRLLWQSLSLVYLLTHSTIG